MKPLTIKCALNILVLLLMHLANVLTLDVKRQHERFTPDYSIYHNLTSIQSFIEHFCKENKNFVHLVEPDTYVSKNGRRQYVLRIRNFLIRDDSEFVKILLSFGEHAREFLPVETMLFMLEQMMQNFRSGILEIDLNKLELYIIVISNPDGRFHVEKTENYCWRGTSTGVDINRNFEWEFGGKGSSSDPLDEEYRGPKPFSEPETNIYRYITEHVQFDGFLSLHSGVKQIYIPYADTTSRMKGRLPDNIVEMRKLAQLLSTSTKHIYKYGGASILNGYTADGTVFDYMAGIRKIPFTYAIELWGTKDHKGPSCFDLFNPPNEKLKTVISEIYPMYVTFFNYILDWKNRTMQVRLLTDQVKGQTQQDDGSVLPYEPKSSRTQQHKTLQVEMPSITPGFILLCIVVMVTVVLGFTGKYPVCRRWYQRRRVVNLRALSSTLSFNLFSS